VTEQVKPNIVMTHAYEGGHPDHDALALACHIARELHSRRNSDWSFDLMEFTSYHARVGGIHTYDFLPGDEERGQSYRLTAAECELKVHVARI